MRKIIVFLVAIVTGLAAVLQTQLGLTISLAAAMASIGALITYIFGEMKNDFQRVKDQIIQQGKFKDPAFWGAVLAGILPVINSTFKLNLSSDIIASICAIVVGILGVVFYKRQKTV